jgi:transcriptional antiterminator RfaH
VTTSSIPRWYVVQTHPHAERNAVAHLERQGFTTYLPRYLKRRRHARRVETVAAPLFPRYVFVLIDLARQPCRPIKSTIGVAQLVCFGEKPAPVPLGVVEAIKRQEDERGFVRLPTRPRFACGERVRVLEGVFSSSLGLYEGMVDADRVAVLLDLLGRKVRVVMNMESMTAA